MSAKFSASSVSIRYSASSPDDDNDASEPFLDNSRSDQIEFKVQNGATSEEKDKVEPVVEDVNKPQTLLLTKEEKETEKEKSSLLSGIRNKFHDKIPEPLSAFIEKKLEGMSRDSSPDETKAKKVLAKSDSLDSGFSQRLAGADGTPERSSHSTLSSSNGVSRRSLNDELTPMEDDYFLAEAPSSIVNTSNSTDNKSVRERTTSLESRLPSKLQKYINNKRMTKIPKSESLSFAELTDNRANDTPTPPLEEENDEHFYEAATDDPISEDLEEAATQERNKSRRIDITKWLSRQRLSATAVFVVSVLVLPIPSFLAGLLIGCLLTSILFLLYLWLMAPPPEKEPFKLPPLESLKPLQVPASRQSFSEDRKFKVWMNELRTYDETNFHINKTHSVYLTLEGTQLRLQRPKHGIPKRAMFDETLTAPVFVHQRYLDLINAKVYLLPYGLVNKRVWSKKYPICIDPAKKHSPKASPEKVLQNEEKAGENEAEQFELVSENQAKEGRLIYLFARTGRQKEEWFQRLSAAAQGNPMPTVMDHVIAAVKVTQRSQRRSSFSVSQDATSEEPISFRQMSFDHGSVTTPCETPTPDSPASKLNFNERYLAEHLHYISKVIPNDQNEVVRDSKGKVEVETLRHFSSQVTCEPQIAWVNALTSRCLWDFLHVGYWKDKLQAKIQKKLSKIHVPYFIDELTVTSIELGADIPTIRRSASPKLDSRGMWIDLDIAYDGGFQINLETKVNLMKLKKDAAHAQDIIEENQALLNSTESDKRPSAVTNSDEEDSAESSSEEENEELVPENSKDYEVGYESKSKKLLRLVDRITASKYFQQATENKYIKKAMQEVSNTRIMMTVSLHSLHGTLAVNVPPPPTDRIWYGFRTNPKLWLSAKPKVGEREVTVTHITEWIEKKLVVEFQRVLVMPNMDDIPVPLMIGQNIDPYKHDQPATPPSQTLAS